MSPVLFHFCLQEINTMQQDIDKVQEKMGRLFCITELFFFVVNVIKVFFINKHIQFLC